MVREQPMTDEVLGHMTSSRLQKRRDPAGPFVKSASPPGAHGSSPSSHSLLWCQWNFNQSRDVRGETKNTETHKLTNSQTRKMLLQHHQSSETIQGCLASVGDRRSRSEEAGPWRQNRQIRSRGSYEMKKIK